MAGKVICITGIDTDIGKTIVTGRLGGFLRDLGFSVITQKICQTGCVGISEDIITHRRLMGMELRPEDINGLTCPYVFHEPCSPHLAAQLEHRVIEPGKIESATQQLAERYDFVLLEGVGGLMVPLLPDLVLVDYLKGKGYYHLLVSCARLGSINHTLAALEIIRSRELHLLGIVYNRFMDGSAAMAADSRECFGRFLKKYDFFEDIVDFPSSEIDDARQCDFSIFLNNIKKKSKL
jgi:dethiobiotin synthetase